MSSVLRDILPGFETADEILMSREKDRKPFCPCLAYPSLSFPTLLIGNPSCFFG